MDTVLKIFFDVPEELGEGIGLLADTLRIQSAGAEDADLTLRAGEGPKAGLSVRLNGREAHIRYGGGHARFFRALGLLVEAIRDGEDTFERSETPSFERNGPMFDVSRNAAMAPDTVRYILRACALMGLNQFMLYMEDMYAVENRPYFGHMRGRYSAEEIRGLDAYALALGIELVPCVQVLGHMAQYLNWPAMKPLQDAQGVLLAGSEDTYALIDDMLAALRGAFSSKRLHIGMDEAYEMGLGNYFHKNGYHDRFEVFCDHLHRVRGMAHAHGFEDLMMWSDMFFRIAAPDTVYNSPDLVFPQRVLDNVPKDVHQVYWVYGANVHGYTFDQHKLLCDRTIFAGGINCWMTFSPLYSLSRENLRTGLALCREKGVREVIATVWHNTTQSSLITALPGLAMYAEYDYTGVYDEAAIARRFAFIANARMEDFMLLEQADHPDGGGGNAAGMLLFNDPLIGLYDRHVMGVDTRAYYERLWETFADLGPREGMFRPAFDVMRSLVRALALKADFGVRLKGAYDAGDREALEALVEDSREISRRIAALRLAHQESWYYYNKPFGWECMDILYGTALVRQETARRRVEDYLAGKIERIDELQEARLWFDGRTEPQEHPMMRMNLRFPRYFTPGMLH